MQLTSWLGFLSRLDTSDPKPHPCRAQWGQDQIKDIG